jgi:gamma-glutamylcyclotransferase (GGCT)/AIG2-like uncharacterized protein YtfP
VRPFAHVFAYGSLARDHGGRPARLRGVRRAWGVAMDNRHVIPGYKVWLDPADGTRPPVHVVFLDLVPAARAAVAGVLLPVSRAALARLDARERNYARVDVTDRLEAGRLPTGARVWAYVGSAAGRARFRAGQAAGTAVVAGAYLDAVRSAFSAAIPAPPVPVRRLARRDVPPLR